MKDYSVLERNLGYSFQDKKLLTHALTHSSYASEHDLAYSENNERLEFIGDAYLDAIIGNKLYEVMPNQPEGVLSKTRANIVCERSLATIARNIGLGDFLFLGNGEEMYGGREKDSILADAVEAIIAAMYLDGGMEKARAFVMSRVLNNVEITEAHRSADYKTDLQELVQRKSGQHIRYEMIDQSGPDHNKVFTFRVSINGQPAGEGSGRTKKEAEQMAACMALEALRK